MTHLKFKQQSLNYSLNMSEKFTPINYALDLESLFQCDAELLANGEYCLQHNFGEFLFKISPCHQDKIF